MESRFVETCNAAALRNSPVRANSLTNAVHGDSIAPHVGTVWLGSFIRLAAPLGPDPRTVRTSVFRLSRVGWRASEQIGRRSYCNLTAAGRKRFEHACRRDYFAPRSSRG